jgi:hypothetical protein
VYGEGLSFELGSLGIRVLIVEPASVKTSWAQKSTIDDSNPIQDYDGMRVRIRQSIPYFIENSKIEPSKAAEVIVATATMESGGIECQQQGTEWPLYLPLGPAAVQAVKDKSNRIISAAESLESMFKRL